MQIYTGTSGFSYPEWKGSFYPAKTPAKNMLAFYSTKLRTVEINNTFYRMPREGVIESWKNQVDEGFLFSVKTPRRITHFKKLADTAELLDYFVKGLAGFGNTLGPVLVQCPPTLQASPSLLESFLKEIESAEKRHFTQPARLRLAFEFRHKSWFDDTIYGILANKDAALVGGDVDEEAKSPPLVKTGNHVYLRLRKTEYEKGEVKSWATKIKLLGVEEAFVYFKHEVIGPELAAELASYF